MSAHPNLDDIMRALKKSGYLMEQEVASDLEALDFHVHTNWAFEDADEGKSREIDVRAIKRVAHNEEKCLSAFVEILIECKNIASPLVLIARNKNRADALDTPNELVFPVHKYEMTKKLDSNRSIGRRIDPFFHLGFDKVHYDYLRDFKAVQFCRIDRNGNNWKASHGGLYDSIFYPISKAVMHRKNELSPKQGDRWHYFWIIVPMVVVSGDIYFVDSMQSAPRPQIANFLSFKREIRSKNLNGTFTIEFARQECVANFVTDCIEPLVDKVSALTMEEAEFVLSNNIPWVE